MSEKSEKTQGFVPLWASVMGLALFVTGAAWYGYSNWLEHKAPAEGTDAIAHRKAPLFSLPDASGKTHSLTQLKGKWVILHFWASWCPPCIDEIPHFLEFAEKMKDAPLGIVTVSLDSAWAEALKMLPEKSLTGTMVSLLDTSLKVPESYGSYQYPESYLLKPEGEGHVIRTKWVGAQDWQTEKFQKELREVFKRETPNVK